MKIISGGQTGVDRGALEAALAAGTRCGGWCPEGRLAEDGRIPDRYPVQELPGGGYRQRTERNVQASDATVIIYFGFLAGGTEQTLEICLKERKPYLLLDGLEVDPERAAHRIEAFVRDVGGDILNVAGPRASGEPRAQGYTVSAIGRFIELAGSR